ncbi:GIY-YIG nuclease family protein [Streptomyces sp. NPDC058548]|uniref:GIY-YIG nuclease family protein n=1 Tax=Streptomyces sp. NPDC058548 TaxID=3346545 RepID=UPI003647E82A
MTTTEAPATAPPTADEARGTIVPPASPDDVAIYRLFNRDSDLLYIGASKDPVYRWGSEHRHNWWWPEVVHYEWGWFPSRAEARAVEREVLASGVPKYNIHGTPKHGSNWKEKVGR